MKTKKGLWTYFNQNHTWVLKHENGRNKLSESDKDPSLLQSDDLRSGDSLNSRLTWSSPETVRGLITLFSLGINICTILRHRVICSIRIVSSLLLKTKTEKWFRSRSYNCPLHMVKWEFDTHGQLVQYQQLYLPKKSNRQLRMLWLDFNVYRVIKLRFTGKVLNFFWA